MTPERFQQINALVDTALELPSDRRAAFLDQACAGDKELRQEAERLLAAHGAGDDFLAAPAVQVLAQDMAAAEPESRMLAGRQLGRYHIVARLGAGGIGEVWLARDTQLAREVALKVLSAELAGDPDLLGRFHREARAASMLNHPNIVTIHELGRAEGVDFIVQEYVQGETLRQHLAGGAMRLDSALDVAAQIGAALAAAHTAQIVHRDIKPENVMVRPDGLVKVLDFGLARFFKRQPLAIPGKGEAWSLAVTRPGSVMGTVKYMSPEQARGLEVDPRSDIFSWGVVLYEMVTGTSPFSGRTPTDVLVSVLHYEPPPLSHYSPGIPEEVESIVRKCLEKDRERRYQAGDELCLDLDRLVRRSPPAGARSGATVNAATPKRLRTWSANKDVTRTRSWRKEFLIALAGMLAVAGYALYSALSRNRSAAPFNLMRISRMTTRGSVLDAVISPDGKYFAYVLAEAGGESLWMKQLVTPGDVRILGPEAGGHWGLAFSTDGDYLYYIRRDANNLDSLFQVPALGGKAREVLADVNGPISFAPDGKQFAFIRFDPTRWEAALMVANSDGSGGRKVAARQRPRYYSERGLAWSPDGRSIVCLAGDAAASVPYTLYPFEVRVADGSERRLTAPGWAGTGSVVWSADGRSLILAANENSEDALQVWLISYPGGAVRRVTNDLNNYATLSLTSDGRTLLAVQTETTADIWLAPSGDAGRAVRISSGNLRGLSSIAWTPDGRIVYAARAGDYRNIWIMDADGQNLTQLTVGPENKDELAVSSDGRHVLYQSNKKIWRVNLDGSSPRQLTHGALDVHPCSSADGRWVIYTSFTDWSPVIGGKPTLWRAPMSGGEPIQLTQEPSSLAQISPDGKLIACAYFTGQDPRFSRAKIAILPFEGGPPVKLLDTLPDADSQVHWTADGKSLCFSRTIGGIGNIWQQPLNGGPPMQMTNFKVEEIFKFAWSADGRQLALARGRATSDVVLIRDFR